jgi:hypothetical protein
MSFSKTTSALFLSLLLALSTTTSVAHNLYFHDANLYQHDRDGHNGHDGHDGHDESSCAFTVVQYSESSLAQEIHSVSFPICNQKKVADYIDAQFAQQNIGNFARAPPFSL